VARTRSLRVQLKRRVSTSRGGDYNEVLQAIQKKSRPSPSNSVTPFACRLLSEQGFGFRKANVVECRVFASHFPSDEVQNEAEVRGSPPVAANDLSNNTAAVAVLIYFALYWASMFSKRLERQREATWFFVSDEDRGMWPHARFCGGSTAYCTQVSTEISDI